jgi:lysozyme
VEYSFKNWNPRWIVEGDGSGWMMDISDPKINKPVTPAESKVTSQDGVDLIKTFEGCELQAYPDPGTGGDPWTIGYGHTGPEVVPGVTVTQAEAEQLLKQDLHRFESAVSKLIEVPFTQHEFDATVSFAYNVGEGALSSSTFRRRINAGEDKATCFREEFPKWVNGANGPLPGLVRRRDAEVELATT